MKETSFFRFEVNDSPSWIPAGPFGDMKTTTEGGGDGKWYLHVQAQDPAGNVGEVKTVHAVFDNTAPTVVADPDPEGRVFAQAQTVRLTADEPADIYYTTNGDIPNTGSVKYHGEFIVDTTTILRFMAVDPAGNTSGAIAKTYTIDADAPDAPVLTPVGSESLDDNTPILKWSAVSDAVNYTLQYGDNADFTGAAGETGLIDTAYTVPNALEDGLWYWRVKAVDAAGNESPWSAVDVFTVDAETHRVPDEYGTIQEAMDAAADGETVLVSPGTYTEKHQLQRQGHHRGVPSADQGGPGLYRSDDH